MDRYMITHSLLSSWLYSMKENPFDDDTNALEDPLGEFRRVLNREPTPRTPAIIKGIDFENLVTSCVFGQGDEGDAWFDAASKISSVLAGGQLQVKRHKTVEVFGMQILLYGRLDALKAGSIYDIKYSEKYDRGKFFSSTQHPMYLELVPEANNFTYLISNGKEVWTETYSREDTASIIPTVAEFLSWLVSIGLMDTYRERWLAL